MTVSGPLLLVGCGKMGGAMLRGWLQRGMRASDVTVVEPHATPLADLAAQGVAVVGAASPLPSRLAPAVVVLAVKPQMTDAVLPAYRRFGQAETVFLSIVAGRTIGYLERGFGEAAAVVRGMPNTPAAVGRGITVACPNGRVTPAQRAACD